LFFDLFVAGKPILPVSRPIHFARKPGAFGFEHRAVGFPAAVEPDAVQLDLKAGRQADDLLLVDSF